MVARVRTVSFHGVDVRDVDVEVQIASGVVNFMIVGLPDKAVAESKERVRSALHALGLSLPAKRLIVNLAPADLAKEGSHYDLPIALGLLAAMGVVPQDALQDTVVLGELSLDSMIRAVAGVLPAAMHAASNDNRLICPGACGGEAAWVGGIDILAPRDLLQLINHFKGTQVLSAPKAGLSPDADGLPRITDIGDVRGQETAKRALEIAAAGGHNLLMTGPPGSGKSMLASCLPGILPPLSPREALEVSMVHSLAGTLPEGGLLKYRPFRDPHHSASLPALVGGGQKARPGEISLAHHGVLFLDELPEFARQTLESLRQPLETGQVSVARANHHVTYPARFQLIAAMNPCRCGYLGDPGMECTKAPKCGTEYQNRLSGPLLDRIDLQVDVPPVAIKDLGPSGSKTAERSETVSARIVQARDIQHVRQNGQLNAHLTPAQLDQNTWLEDQARHILTQAGEQLKLSARAYHRLIRAARTIADLSDSETVTRAHAAEALSYRRLRLISD